MTIQKAKKAIREIVGKDFILTGRTVSFVDLAREQRIFIEVIRKYNFMPFLDLPTLKTIESLARENHFSVKFK